MKHTLFFILLSFIYSNSSFCMDFDGINCGQTINTPKVGEIEYIDPTFSYKWRAVQNPKGSFRDVEVAKESYLIMNGKFYGKILSITGKDNLNTLLRRLIKDLTGKYEKNVNDNYFEHPIGDKDGSWVFVEPDQVIIYKRYSVHLGHIQILCRNMWEKAMGMSLEQTEK